MPQQWDWIETVLGDDQVNDLTAIEAEGAAFDAWLSEGNTSRLALLRDEVNHTDIRKQSQRAAAQRKLERT